MGVNMVFSRAYQLHLLSCFSRKQYLEEIFQYVHEDAFDQDLVPVVQAVRKEWKQNRTLSIAQIRSILPERMHLEFDHSTSLEFDLDHVRKWMNSKILRDRMVEAITRLESGESSGDVVKELQRNLIHLHNGPDGIRHFDYYGQKGTDITDGRRRPVLMGIPMLDDSMGGVCRGEMALVMAPSNGGKTSFVVGQAANAVARGESVVYASLEMPASAMDLRFNQAMACRKSKKKVKPGALDIICSSPQTLSALGLRDFIMRNGWKPDLVVIDSIDLLANPRKFGSRWEEEAESAEAVKALAMELDCAVWVSAQSNRPGYERDVLKMSNVKGSLARVQLADHVVTMNQSDSEMLPDESGISYMRIHLAKCRFGRRGAISMCSVDFERCLFQEDAGGI